MMTPRKLLVYMTTEPFRPFRLSMASGKTFEVRHPENIAISKSSARIYAPKDGDEEGPDFWHDISLMLIEFVEFLEPHTSHDQ
jgi:hypothetical protein